MTIWYSTYQLFPRGTLKSAPKPKFRKGALLRVRFPSGNVGFADVCPFSEMGDQPLETELRALVQAKPLRIGARALHFAEMDAQARAKKVSLYAHNVRIKNHFLIADIHRFALDRVEVLEAAGFTEFKIKLGKDLPCETEFLERMTAQISAQSRLRLDFNALLGRDRFVQWFEKNQRWLRPHLEFIEDPFVYDPNEWREVSDRWNITFALDLAADPVKTQAEGAQIIVIKPALQDEVHIINHFKEQNKKFILTHYMDFPVGQMFALVSAQKIFLQNQDKILTCGLQHHDIYEGFTFQDAIKQDGPFILPPNGYGIGFDSLMESQDWTELK